MSTYIEIDLDKRQTNLLERWNKMLKAEYSFIIDTPKICINNIGGQKVVQLAPNTTWWVRTVFRTSRQKDITINEAKRKTTKFLEIVNGYTGL